MAILNPHYPKDWRLSYSSNGTFDSCMRRFELSRGYKQLRAWEDSIASGSGTSLHHGIQSYMEFNDPDKAMWALMTSYPHALSMGPTDDRSLEACMSTLELMMEVAHNQEFELAKIRRPELPDRRAGHEGEMIPSEIVGATEVPFEIEIVRSGGRSALVTGGRLTFVGFIDAIMTSRYTGRFRCTDVKTHRDNKHDRSSAYKFNTQQTPYGAVLEHIQGGEVLDFDVNYLDCFVDLVNPRVENYDYTRSRQDVMDWFANRIIQVQRLNAALASSYFPRTENGCTFFNRPCRYMDVCESRDPDTVQSILLMGGEPDVEKPFDAWINVQLEVPDAFDLMIGD